MKLTFEDHSTDVSRSLFCHCVQASKDSTLYLQSFRFCQQAYELIDSMAQEGQEGLDLEVHSLREVL